MKPTNTYQSASDDIEIFFRSWPVKKPKAVIALVHGLGEHCTRYDHMAEFYAKNNIAMIGYDRRGHGQSEGKIGHTKSLALYLEEITMLLNLVAEQYPGIPKLLYGHSFGGNLSLNYILDHPTAAQALICTGPLIKIFDMPSKTKIGFARLAAKVTPSLLQATDLNVNHISTEKAEVEKYNNDPLVHGKISVRAGMVMLDAIDRLQKHKGTMPVPTLIMHAIDDKLSDVEGSRLFIKNVKGIDYKEWENVYHEIHNDKDRLAVFNHTLAWINQLV